MTLFRKLLITFFFTPFICWASESDCNKELIKNCPKAKTQNEKVACITNKIKSFSVKCQSEIVNNISENTDKGNEKVCYEEISKFCPDYSSQCFKNNINKVRPKCRELISAASDESIEKFSGSCMDDVLKLCPLDKNNDISNPDIQKKFENCVAKSIQKLPAKCLEMFGASQLQNASSIKVIEKEKR